MGLCPPQTPCPQPAPGTVSVMPASPTGTAEIWSAQGQLVPRLNRWPGVLEKPLEERLTFAYLFRPTFKLFGFNLITDSSFLGKAISSPSLQKGC